MKKAIVLITIFLLNLLMTGCDSVEWFEKKPTGEIVAYTDKEIKTDTYYVKQGTRFYEIYNPDIGASNSKSSSVKPNRVIPLCKNEHKIPSFYKGELLAYKTNKTMPSEILLERFKDLGYSLGVWGGYIDDKGFFYFNRKRSLVEESSFGEFLKNAKSDDIRISAINGQKINAGMLDTESGVITGLEEGKSYDVEMYIGSVFTTCTVIADTKMLKSYEIYDYDSSYIEFTSNGYLSFQCTEELKSGYYFVNGEGLFAYYAFPRGEAADANMNESFYKDERERLESYSRQYTANIKSKIKDMEIQVRYIQDNDTDETSIKGYAFSPEGTEYEMQVDTDKNTISLKISEAMVGEWKINIVPKELSVTDVAVNSSKIEEESTLVQQDFEFLTSDTNILFYADFAGSKDVYGYVVSPDGRTYEMPCEYDDKKNKGKIYYNMTFLQKGVYSVKIYYHTGDTTVSEITKIKSAETDVDVIVVTE